MSKILYFGYFLMKYSNDRQLLSIKMRVETFYFTLLKFINKYLYKNYTVKNNFNNF